MDLRFQESILIMTVVVKIDKYFCEKLRNMPTDSNLKCRKVFVSSIEEFLE